MRRQEIVGELLARRAAGKDISFTGLRTDGGERLLGAAIKEFGKYRKAVEAAGIDYQSVVRTKPKGHWDKLTNQRKAVDALARQLGKPATSLSTTELRTNGLGSLLQKYEDRVVRLLRAIGYPLKELRGRQSPKGHWRFRRNRTRAVREVLGQSEKRFQELSANDFRRFGVGGLVDYASKRGWSIYHLLREAGFKGRPWLLLRVGNRHWVSVRERRRAIRWLVEKAKKDHHHVTQKDFRDHGLAALLGDYYTGSPYQALRDAGFKIDPLRFSLLPDGYYDNSRNRKAMFRMIMRAVGRERPEDVTVEGIRKLGANSLYKHFGSVGNIVRAMGGDDSLLRPGSYRFKSKHGHWFKSAGESKLDDILHERFNLRRHAHNVRYPASRMNCDFVTHDRALWVEYAGMVVPHPPKAWIPRVTGYLRKLREKRRIAKRHHLNLVVVYPGDLRDRGRLETKLRKAGVTIASR